LFLYERKEEGREKRKMKEKGRGARGKGKEKRGGKLMRTGVSQDEGGTVRLRTHPPTHYHYHLR
jgi:hypothetical protein